MWRWIQDHRRKQILDNPFPESWELILKSNVAHYRRLHENERKQLKDLIQVFIAEKNWEGCGGLVLTDEIKVTIAAQACLLILSLHHDLYRHVGSILIYPTTVVIPGRALGAFEVARAPIAETVPILGQAELRGPVVLAWDYVRSTARHTETGRNVVYHEFAHKLDMLDGRADGTPPLSGSDQYKQWGHVFEREFLQLRADVEKGKHTFLDAYGATNEAEFFAVVTEQFFDQPLELEKHCPDLYGVLRDFYRQDPALRVLEDGERA